MKKYLTIAAICIIIALIGYHFLGPEGGLLGILGLGGVKFRDSERQRLKDEIAELDIELDKPVEDLSDKEIEDFWNNK